MAAILILLIISFLLFYLLSSEIWVRIIKEEMLTFEFHTPLFAISLTENSNGRQKKDKKERLSYLAYIRIISAVIEKAKKTKIEIKKIHIPIEPRDLTGSGFSKPLKYQYLIFSLIAYFRKKTKKITIEDNALFLSPDITTAQFYITLKPRLYEIISAYLTYRRQLKTEKERATKNVRE